MKTCARRRARLVACAALLTVMAGPAVGLTINGGTDDRNDRFVSGYPGAPVPNTSNSFIGAAYDWSGVGWSAADPTRSYALLGPDQILIANHYPPAIGATIDFLSTDNVVVSATVASEQGIHTPYTSDLAVATFTSPIPAGANVNCYSILFEGYSPDLYIGDPVLMYGRHIQTGGVWIGSNTIAGAGQILAGMASPYGPDYSQYFFCGYDSTTPNRAIVQNGDSGSPSFIILGGQMYLAGGHYLLTSDPKGSVDTSTSLSVSTLDSYMGQSGYLPYLVTPTTARWTPSSSGAASWASSANWSTPEGAPTSVPADAMSGGTLSVVNTAASVLFDGAATSQTTISLGGSQTVTSITFASAPGPNPFTITGSSTDLLTIGEAGITNQDDDAQTIACPVALRTSQRWAVGSGGLIVSGPIDLGSGATGNLLLVEGTGNTLLSGLITGSSGSLSMYGGGTVTLSNSGNNYGGQTLINGGTLLLGAAGALPSTSNVTISGGTLDLGGYSISAGTVTLQSGAISSSGSGDSLTGAFYDVRSGTIDANLGGSAALTKSTTGIVTLGGANSYTGGTTVNAGNLVFSSTAAIPAGTQNILIASGGALNVAGAYTTVATWLLSGNINTASAGALALTADSSETISMSGYSGLSLGSAASANYTGTLTPAGSTYRLGGGGGTLTLPGDNALTGSNALLVGAAGPGTVVLAGSNSYTGGTTFSAGQLDINNPYALGTGPLTISGGTIGNSSGLAIALSTNNAESWNGNFTFAGSNDLNLGTGAVALGGNRTVTVNSNTLTVGGAISGSGFSLTMSGPGTLVLGGANGYSGDTIISSGTLRLGSANALPSGSGMGNVVANGLLDLAGYSATLNGLSGSGSVDNSGTNAVALTVGANNATSTFAGSIANSGTATAAAAVLSLVKTGTGMLVLGGANSYTGGTTVNAGNLVFSSTAAIPAGTQNITIASGGALNVTGAYTTVADWLSSGNINIASAGALALTASSSTETISMSGYSSLSLGSAASTTYTGTLTPAGSTYRLGGGGGTLTLPGSNALTGSNALLVGSAGPGTVVLAGTNSYTGGTTISGGTLVFASPAALPNTGILNIGRQGEVDLTDLLSSSSLGTTDRSASLAVAPDSTGALAATLDSSAAGSSSGFGAVSLPAGRSSAAQGVPEPATWALLAAAGIVAMSWCVWRRRRRRSLV